MGIVEGPRQRRGPSASPDNPTMFNLPYLQKMKKAILTFAVLCVFGFGAAAQSVDTTAVLSIDPIQIDPQFPGGSDSMYAFIARNYRIPNKCYGVKGTIWVRFVVERDGTVSNVEVIRGLCKEFDEEALRVVRMMPRWIPCRFAGSETPTRTSYNLPIKFDLE